MFSGSAEVPTGNTGPTQQPPPLPFNPSHAQNKRTKKNVCQKKNRSRVKNEHRKTCASWRQHLRCTKKTKQQQTSNMPNISSETVSASAKLTTSALSPSAELRRQDPDPEQHFFEQCQWNSRTCHRRRDALAWSTKIREKE